MTVAEHPPLRVWIGTALILLIVLAWLALTAHSPGSSPATPASLNLNRLRERSPHAIRIVALGSSKTVYAIEFDQALAARLHARTVPMLFHRVTWEDAKAPDLEPALAALKMHPPDLLLIESDLLLLYHRARFPIREKLLPLERYVHTALAGGADANSPLEVNSRQNRGGETFAPQAECTARQSPEMRLIYAAHVETWHLTDASLREPYLAALRALRAAGTRIVLLDLPRAEWADAVFPARLHTGGAAIRSRLLRDERFSAWSPGPIDAAGYCDEAHMNRVGRNLYSRWLAGQIDAALEDPHD